MNLFRLTRFYFLFFALLLCPSLNAETGIYKIQVNNVEYEINPDYGTADVIDCATWLKELNVPSVIFNMQDSKEYKVRSIRRRTFDRNDSIRVVTIDNGVAAIEDSAFVMCKSLVSVTVSAGMKEIGLGSFAGCKRLKKLSIGDGITVIPKYMAADCDSLVTVSLPNSVTSVKESAFGGCGRLVDFVFPTRLNSIGAEAFKGCSSLEKALLPDGLTSIGSGAFEGCDSLGEVSFPPGLTSIGAGAFKGCSSLGEVSFPSSLVSIYSSAFESSGLKVVDLSNNASCYLGENVFSFCNELVSAILPDNITEIPAGLFSGCTKLEITLPQSLMRIGDSAFRGCGFRSINIPPNVVEVGAYSFTGTDEVTGCEGLEVIGEYAFSGDISVFPFSNTALKTIGDYAFRYNQLKVVELPEGLTSIGEGAFSPASMDNKYRYGLDLDANGNLRATNNAIESVVIPSTLERWGAYAFSGCNNLVSLKINNAKVRFSDCCYCPKLEHLDLGDSVTYVGGLGHCPRLTDLTIPGSAKGFKALENANLQILRFKYGEGALVWNDYLDYYQLNKKLKYLYLDREVESRVDLIGLRTLIIGDNIKEIRRTDLVFSNESPTLISAIFGKSLEKFDFEGGPTLNFRANYLIFRSIFPPQGDDAIYMLEHWRDDSRCWVPGGSETLYKEYWDHSMKWVNMEDDRVTDEDVMFIDRLAIPRTFEIPYGQIAEIPVTCVPENASIKKPVWISLNQDVISLNEDGQLKANIPGVADVYCLSADGSDVKSNLCTVTVTDAKPQGKISIHPHSVNLEKGEHMQLKVLLVSDGSEISDVDWSSSDESIAMVSPTGIVLARNDGRAIIKAELKANSDITDSIEVVVGNSGVGDVSGDSYSITTRKNRLVINNYNNEYVMIATPSGIVEYAGCGEHSFSISSGIYIVKIESRVFKVVIP